MSGVEGIGWVQWGWVEVTCEGVLEVLEKGKFVGESYVYAMGLHIVCVWVFEGVCGCI